jgi:hypothetical protein
LRERASLITFLANSGVFGALKTDHLTYQLRIFAPRVAIPTCRNQLAIAIEFSILISVGPDALAEIVAMMFYRLGAGKAASITFFSNGASWNWERIGQKEQTGICKAMPSSN